MQLQSTRRPVGVYPKTTVVGEASSAGELEFLGTRDDTEVLFSRED